MRPDQCRLEFVDLQETVLPDIKIRADFDICTWKVRVIRLFNVRQIIYGSKLSGGSFLGANIIVLKGALFERPPLAGNV